MKQWVVSTPCQPLHFIGHVIAVNQVLDVLGKGTFGQVLKAWRADTSQLVALKVILLSSSPASPQSGHSAQVLKNIPSYTKQGQLEIDVLTRLSCQAAHEFNIVEVTHTFSGSCCWRLCSIFQAYESFSHRGHICISFELLEINLYEYLKQNR